MFLGKEGNCQCFRLVMTYLENDAGAPLAPLLVTEKNHILECYADPLERAALKLSFENVTVIEPPTKGTVTPEVEERIQKLEALKLTTKLPQLANTGMDAWKARLGALDCNPQNVKAKDIGDPVPEGLKLKTGWREGKEPWCNVALKSIDALLKSLRDVKPLTSDALRKAKREAFGDAFVKLVELVEAAEEKAIDAMPTAEPAFAEALKKRFAPRAEAATQRASDIGVKGGEAKIRKAKEQGLDPLAPANKELAKSTFGRCQKVDGDARAPNNNYKPYVFKRIEHGIAEATNITSWMKYGGAKKKKKNKRRK